MVDPAVVAVGKGFPGLSDYCATKYAVAVFPDGLRMEVGQEHNIRVTGIQPGAVAIKRYDHFTDPGHIDQTDDLARQMAFLPGIPPAEPCKLARRSQRILRWQDRCICWQVCRSGSVLLMI